MRGGVPLSFSYNASLFGFDVNLAGLPKLACHLSTRHDRTLTRRFKNAIIAGHDQSAELVSCTGNSSGRKMKDGKKRPRV